MVRADEETGRVETCVVCEQTGERQSEYFGPAGWFDLELRTTTEGGRKTVAHVQCLCSVTCLGKYVTERQLRV